METVSRHPARSIPCHMLPQEVVSSRSSEKQIRLTFTRKQCSVAAGLPQPAAHFKMLLLVPGCKTPQEPWGCHKKRERLSAGETQESKWHGIKPLKCASRSELCSVAFKCISKYQKSLSDTLRGCILAPVVGVLLLV